MGDVVHKITPQRCAQMLLYIASKGITVYLLNPDSGAIWNLPPMCGGVYSLFASSIWHRLTAFSRHCKFDLEHGGTAGISPPSAPPLRTYRQRGRMASSSCSRSKVNASIFSNFIRAVNSLAVTFDIDVKTLIKRSM